MKTDYLPVRDSDLNLWLKNYVKKLNGYTATFGISAAEFTAVQNDAAYLEHTLNTIENIGSYSEQVTEFKKLLYKGTSGGGMPVYVPGTAPVAVPMGIITRLRAQVQRIKNHNNYTVNIGNDLGIEGAEKTVVVEGLKPVLKVSLEVGHPKLKWQKMGSDRLNIYADYGEGKGFALISTISRRQFVDATALPANPIKWKYKAIFVINDEEVGQFSDEVFATVSTLV